MRCFLKAKKNWIVEQQNKMFFFLWYELKFMAKCGLYVGGYCVWIGLKQGRKVKEQYATKIRELETNYSYSNVHD